MLRLSGRRRLLRYANRLGISRFDAHLMIVEAQRERADGTPSAGRRTGESGFVKPPAPGPVWSEPGYLRNLLLISAGALLLDAWLISWLF